MTAPFGVQPVGLSLIVPVKDMPGKGPVLIVYRLILSRYHRTRLRYRPRNCGRNCRRTRLGPRHPLAQWRFPAEIKHGCDNDELAQQTHLFAPTMPIGRVEHNSFHPNSASIFLSLIVYKRKVRFRSKPKPHSKLRQRHGSHRKRLMILAEITRGFFAQRRTFSAPHFLGAALFP